MPGLTLGAEELKTPANAALAYHPDSYVISRSDLNGRHSAGAGFLRGFVRHAQVDSFHCYLVSNSPSHRSRFQDQIDADNHRNIPSRFITRHDFDALASVGCMMMPAPLDPHDPWYRRHVGNRRYSLCGVTHTICSEVITRVFQELLLSPLQSWDAIICTSRSVRAAIDAYLEGWQEYYQVRFGIRPQLSIQLPIIPLGVDCARYERGATWEQRRTTLRQRLGIVKEDVVILFFGRLSFHGKAHPVPQCRAVERVAGRVRQTLHLVHVGRFYDAATERAYTEAARGFCANARVHFVDGADSLACDQAWAAADIFLSLSDNIQESFGLTVIEAMAAGLPVVVSDWDGYRETVVSGETGYRIRTVTPSPGNTLELGRRFHLGQLDYEGYIGHAAMVTAVDVEACAAALQRLIDDVGLRRRLGELARRRAVEHYDWKLIVQTYQALWTHLAERRAIDSEVAPKRPDRPAHPAFPDPFTYFRHHATAALDPDWSISVADLDVAGELNLLYQHKIATLGDAIVLSRPQCESLLLRCRDFKVSVADVIAEYAQEIEPKIRNTLVWLMKMGLLTIG